MLCWSTHLGSSYARSAMGSEEAYVLSEEDHGWMDYAHSLAEETLRSGEVPVACVIVHGGKVLSQGNNETIITRNPTRHAEMVAFDALDQLGSQDSRKAMLRDSVLYVTCEPCIMCSAAVRQIGVPKVIYGCKNDRFGGCGSVLPVNLDSRIGTGRSFTAYSCPLAAQKAVAILKEFYKQENPNEKRKKGKT